MVQVPPHGGGQLRVEHGQGDDDEYHQQLRQECVVSGDHCVCVYGLMTQTGLCQYPHVCVSPAPGLGLLILSLSPSDCRQHLVILERGCVAARSVEFVMKKTSTKNLHNGFNLKQG